MMKELKNEYKITDYKIEMTLQFLPADLLWQKYGT
jgi:hypothetical protein